MCARFEIDHAVIRRGMKVPIVRGRRTEAARWTGFARAERLDWWRRKGAKVVAIPAERFAECSCVSEDLIWADLQAGEAILGILVESGRGARSLRVITRDPTPEEMLHFQTFRMPVIRRDEATPGPAPLPEAQPELFFA